MFEATGKATQQPDVPNEAALEAARAETRYRVENGTTIPFEYLTPESLLDYCAIKLRGIDSQIQRAFASQKNRNNLNTALSKLSDALSSIQGDIGKDAQDLKGVVLQAYHDAWVAAGGDETDAGRRIAAEKWAFHLTSTGQQPGVDNEDPSVSQDELKNFMGAAQQIQKDVNLEGDLEMIGLQSLMSSRQQAIQMCTNMVSALGQSSQGIAANIGK